VALKLSISMNGHTITDNSQPMTQARIIKDQAFSHYCDWVVDDVLHLNLDGPVVFTGRQGDKEQVTVSQPNEGQKEDQEIGGVRFAHIGQDMCC
jgi:hypothetical protein